MLTASVPDGPAFHTRSHTQSASDSASTPQVIPQPHISQDNDPTPKSLTDDCWEALLQMQCTDPFCKCISKRLLNGRAPHHESDTFTHIKGLLYKHVSDAGKQFPSGNKHTLTIIDHLTGWPEAFPIPDKSADTIVATLINHYLPVHMCPRYILSDNGTELRII